MEVFEDPLFLSKKERTEDGEERWQTFGVVDEVLLLMVAHTVRVENDDDEVFRIISARRASRKERRRYENQNG